MSVFDRLGQVVRAEWTHLRGRRGESNAQRQGEKQGEKRHAGNGDSTPPTPSGRRSHVADVDGALRVLELSGTPTLAEVRARYQALSQRYFPKTQSQNADEAHAARVVLDALTDALELLEEHLLPLPPE